MTHLRIKPNGSRISLQAALSYNPCDGCHRIVGNAEIVSRFCGTCCYGENKKEVMHSENGNGFKSEGDKKEGELGLLPFQDQQGGER